MPYRILILQNKLLPYRVDLYEKINAEEDIDLTIAFPEEPVPGVGFTQIQLTARKLGSFVIISELIKICRRYDVVISMFDIKWISFIKLALLPRRSFSFIFWGIGVSTEQGFDAVKKFDWLRFFIGRRADALLFYSQYAKNKYVKAGFDARQIFVAPNTMHVAVPDSYARLKKVAAGKAMKNLVFIGALSKRKKIPLILQALRAYNLKHFTRPLELIIIGDGSQRTFLEDMVSELDLEKSVQFKGAINDMNLLGAYFEQAIACVSPGQAGLSVLTSFAFGVPFITEKDAITGGERFNIIDGENGFLLEKDHPEQLISFLERLVSELGLLEKMSHAAANFYHTERTIDKMASGFIAAINHLNENS